ncbi:MAG: hypothetical protein ACRDZ9_07995 [Acidimicrobiales bacterium]
MSGARTPLDEMVELLVFAPVGVALAVGERLPELVERGRQQIAGQVATARVIGELAVRHGQGEVDRAVERARDQAQAVLAQLGLAPGPSAATTAGAPTSPEPPPGPSATEEEGAGPRGGDPPATSWPAAELAIPDYDSLSASQVVPRLSGLAPAELEAVRAYEATHRGRQTVLNKIAQLQAE